MELRPSQSTSWHLPCSFSSRRRSPRAAALKKLPKHCKHFPTCMGTRQAFESRSACGLRINLELGTGCDGPRLIFCKYLCEGDQGSSRSVFLQCLLSSNPPRVRSTCKMLVRNLANLRSIAMFGYTSLSSPRIQVRGHTIRHATRAVPQFSAMPSFEGACAISHGLQGRSVPLQFGGSCYVFGCIFR